MSPSLLTLRRPLAAVATLTALVPVALALAPSAGAATPQIRDVTRYACNPALVPEPGFTDVPASGTFTKDIACLAGYGFTQGADATGTRYAPTQRVTRAQMALFVYRVGLYGGVTFDTSSAGFSDIGSLPQAEQDAINGLAHKRVVNGTTQTTYSPGGAVTREQMASFLNRLQAVLAGSGFATTDDYFTDDDRSVHEADINAIASAGIVGGTGAGRYDPAGAVDRQSMAAFLVRYVDADVALGVLASKFPSGAASFTATPSTEVAKEVGSSTSARQYTVQTGKAQKVSIALLDGSQVSAGSSGTTFSSTAPIASGGAVSITDVNGTSTGGTPGSTAKTQVDGVTPKNGQVTFTIDGNAMQQVVPVVWADIDGDKKLGTAAGGYATEPYGVGGRTDYVPAEAATSSTAQSVQVLDRADAVNAPMGYFVAQPLGPGGLPLGNPATYYFPATANDTYGSSSSQISRSQFAGLLTPQDSLDVTYGADHSVFNVTTDVVPAPTGVSARAGDFNGDGLATDVMITWTPSEQTDAVYDVYRDANNDGKADAGELVKAGVTDGSYTAIAQPQGTFSYLVVARGATTGATSDPAPTGSVTLPVPPPHVVANGAVLATDSTFAGRADQGDVLQLWFDQPVQLGASPALQVSGGSSSGTGVLNTSNATFTLNTTTVGLSEPGELVTIRLLGPVQSGGASLSYPLTITAASGISSASGTTWTPSSGTDDVTLDGTVKFVRDDATVGDKTFTVVFNEPLTGTQAQAANNPLTYQVTNGSSPVTVQSAQLQADGQSVVITVTGPLVAGATITTGPFFQGPDQASPGPAGPYSLT